MKSRSERVTEMLETRPGISYAIAVDEQDAAYPGCVVLAVGLRGNAGTVSTCDLIVPRESYDGFALLDVIARQGAAVH